MDWLDCGEVAQLYGLGVRTVQRWVLEGRFKSEKREIRAGKVGAREKWFIDPASITDMPQRDIELVPRERSRAHQRILAWVDSLTEWPSGEEIEAHAAYPFCAKDVVSMLETRVYRGLPALNQLVLI